MEGCDLEKNKIFHCNCFFVCALFEGAISFKLRFLLTFFYWITAPLEIWKSNNNVNRSISAGLELGWPRARLCLEPVSDVARQRVHISGKRVLLLAGERMVLVLCRTALAVCRMPREYCFIGGDGAQAPKQFCLLASQGYFFSAAGLCWSPLWRLL